MSADLAAIDFSAKRNWLLRLLVLNEEVALEVCVRPSRFRSLGTRTELSMAKGERGKNEEIEGCRCQQSS